MTEQSPIIQLENIDVIFEQKNKRSMRLKTYP